MHHCVAKRETKNQSRNLIYKQNETNPIIMVYMSYQSYKQCISEHHNETSIQPFSQ